MATAIVGGLTTPSLPPVRPALLAGAVLLAACGGGAADTAQPAPSPETTIGSTAEPGSTTASSSDVMSDSPTSATSSPDEPTGGDTTSTTAAEVARRPADVIACERGINSSAGDVVRADLVEASGLAASRQHPEVLWAHNDSGQAAGVFALDLAGRDLGFVGLTAGGEPVAGVDIEDIAIVDRTLYVADIGDNARRRDEVVVHVVPEPTPAGDGTVEVDRSIRIRYPDGPTDAEAIVVDPVDGLLVILSKDLDDATALTRIYTVPLDPAAGDTDPVVEATLVGTLDMATISARSSAFSIGGVLYPGSVTGADLSPAGDLLVLRTYGSAWLFPRAPGWALADALAAEPCEGGSAGETQGEAIAFLPDPAPGKGGMVRYVTVGEGRQPSVNVTEVVVGP